MTGEIAAIGCAGEDSAERVASVLEERHTEALTEFVVDLRFGHEGAQHTNDGLSSSKRKGIVEKGA